MTREEAITVMQLYKDELEHRIAIAKIDYDPGAIDMYSIQLDAFDVAIEALSADTVSREAHYDAVANRITDMEERGFVSVVRCKDCRHRDLFSCPLADNDFQKDEDFCSWGERREP